MMAMRWSKLMAITVLVRVPSIGSNALNDGTASTVNSGTCSRYSSRVSGRMNMLRQNSACQAYSVMMRMGKR